MRLPRRKLLLASVAAPALLRTQFAKAFLPHGGGGVPPPPSDGITAILATMVSGQWKKLTGATLGSMLAQTLARTQANFDPGGTAGVFASPVTFPSTAGAIDYGGTGATIPHIWSFSTSAIRKSDGLVCHGGGGGHVATFDNGTYGFNTHDACASRLANSDVPNATWAVVKRAGTARPQTLQAPSWSSQTPFPAQVPAGSGDYGTLQTTGDTTSGSNVISNVPTTTGSNGVNMGIAGIQVGGPTIPPFQHITAVSGSAPNLSVTFGPGTASGNQSAGFVGLANGNSWWADVNIDGQKCVGSQHTYWYPNFDPTNGRFVRNGEGSYPSSSPASNANAYEVIDPSAAIPNNNIYVPGNYAIPGGFDDCGLSSDTGVYYSCGVSVAQLTKVTGLSTASPSATTVGIGNYGIGPDLANRRQGLIIVDPINGNTKRAFYGTNAFGGNFFGYLVTDLAGSPVGHSWSGWVPVGDPNLVTGTALTLCYDSLRNLVIGSYGTQWLQTLYINGGNLSASVWAIEQAGGTWASTTYGAGTSYTGSGNVINSVTASGDIPTQVLYNGNGVFPRINYLPSYDCYVLEVGGNVYIRKP